MRWNVERTVLRSVIGRLRRSPGEIIIAAKESAMETPMNEESSLSSPHLLVRLRRITEHAAQLVAHRRYGDERRAERRRLRGR